MVQISRVCWWIPGNIFLSTSVGWYLSYHKQMKCILWLSMQIYNTRVFAYWCIPRLKLELYRYIQSTITGIYQLFSFPPSFSLFLPHSIPASHFEFCLSSEVEDEDRYSESQILLNIIWVLKFFTYCTGFIRIGIISICFQEVLSKWWKITFENNNNSNLVKKRYRESRVRIPASVGVGIFSVLYLDVRGPLIPHEAKMSSYVGDHQHTVAG